MGNSLKDSSHHFEVLKAEHESYPVFIEFEGYLAEGVKTTKSGRIIVGMNLISLLDESEIAFVISHEFHHLIQKDPIKIHQALIDLENSGRLTKKAIPNRTFSSLYDKFKENEVFRYFVLELEFEADRFAADYLKRNGWDACVTLTNIQSKSGVNLSDRIQEICEK